MAKLGTTLTPGAVAGASRVKRNVGLPRPFREGMVATLGCGVSGSATGREDEFGWGACAHIAH
jgi:hypothetical protein